MKEKQMKNRANRAKKERRGKEEAQRKPMMRGYRDKCSSYLLWWTFYFLQILLYHFLWSFTCRQEKEEK